MPDRDTRDRGLLDLIRNDDWARVAEDLSKLHPADIADVIERAPHEDWERLFALLPDTVKPDVLAELESEAGSEVIESLTNLELSDIVEDMAPDDAADVIGDLDDERSERVLDLMEDEESADVRKLLTYDEESAGGIMTTDVVAMQMEQTVEEAIRAIAYFETGEPFMYAYTVGTRGELLGYVDIWELLRERNKTRKLGELAHADFMAVSVGTDQEEVARLMAQYDLTVVPVVDEHGILVGRITADDVIDVIAEEATEDILRLAGSDDAELEDPSPLKSCMVRLPWLLVTLLGGFLTSFILKRYHAHVSEILVLAAFVPIVLAMGGNTGIQSSTLVVRSIALGSLRNRSVLRLLAREITTGAIMGLVCGGIIGVWAHFLIVQTPGESGLLNAARLASVVAIALFSAMTFATAFGAVVPIILNRARIDPAVASGPFITIANDISALLIYFAVTLALIQAAV